MGLLKTLFINDLWIVLEKLCRFWWHIEDIFCTIKERYFGKVFTTSGCINSLKGDVVRISYDDSCGVFDV